MPFHILVTNTNAFVHFNSTTVYVLVAAISLSVLSCLWSVSRCHFSKGKEGKNKRPPLAPHGIPILGHIPLHFIQNPLEFAHTYHAFWMRHPVRLRAFFQDVYIIQGAEDLLKLMKQRSLSSFLLHRVFLVNVFRLPETAAKAYREDNSGEHSEPHPGSAIKHHNRVEYHVRRSQVRLLLGPGQSGLFQRLYSNTTRHLSSLKVQEQWTSMPDFMIIFKRHLTSAAIDSLVGPWLMERHPGFAEDLWAIDQNITNFILKLPRFFNRTAHQARDRALDAVLDWHAWARQNFNPLSVDDEGNDPFWGCAFFRERQYMFSKMDGFDAQAVASEDLSFIWSANTNAVVSSFWITIEAFLDVDILRTVREEVQACIQESPNNSIQFDIPKLLRQPFLQAMFAESLRLHVHGFLIRLPEREDLHINNWIIPRNHLCIASSTPASMDPDFWCRDGGSGHPVTQFWPGRFLTKDKVTNELKFSLTGTEGFWVPFGGGPHACPGRIFTKRQNIITLALMVTLYDCDILATKKDLSMDSRTYPLGAIPPGKKIPVRLRRRLTPSGMSFSN